MTKNIHISSTQSEFMKIRQYIVEQVLRGGAIPRQIPSARKLAQMFGVSHPTALKALQDLVGSGHLIPCRRGGYLTVPGSFGSNWRTPRIIGVINGAGNYVLYDKSVLIDSNPFLEELLGRSGNFFAENIYLQKQEEAFETISYYQLDGLIWMFPSQSVYPVIQKLKESGLPIVEFGFTSGHASGAAWNFEEDYYRIMKQLLSEGRRHPLILNNSYPVEPNIRGFHRACEEFGVPTERCLLLQGTPEEILPQLNPLLNYGLAFDAIILEGRFGALWPFLTEHFEISEQCRLVCRQYELYADIPFTGYVAKRLNEKPARLLADNFLQQLKDPTGTPVISEEVEIELEFYRNGKPAPVNRK